MKSVPIDANKAGFMSLRKNNFKIVITRATKSDMNPLMLVALTAFNQSVEESKTLGVIC